MNIKEAIFKKGRPLDERKKILKDNLDIMFETELWPLVEKYPTLLTNEYINALFEEVTQTMASEAFTSFID